MVPVLPWLDNLVRNHRLSKESVDALAEYQRYVLLDHVLEGAQYADIPLSRLQLCWPRALVPFFEASGVPFTVDCSVPGDISDGEYGCGACPSWNGQTIGASCLMEAIAEINDNFVLLQPEWRNYYRQFTHMYAWVTDIKDGYRFSRGIAPVLDIFLTSCLGDTQDVYSTQATVINDSEELRLALLSLLPIAELALNSHHHWRYFYEEWGASWFDLHPGWRFVRACRVLHDEKLVLREDLSNWESMQELVCVELGWMPPSVFREVTLRSCPKSWLKVDTPPTHWETRGDERLAKSTKAGLGSPGVFILPDIKMLKCLRFFTRPHGPSVVGLPTWFVAPGSVCCTGNSEFMQFKEDLLPSWVDEPSDSLTRELYVMSLVVREAWSAYIMAGESHTGPGFLKYLTMGLDPDRATEGWLVAMLDYGCLADYGRRLAEFVLTETLSPVFPE